MEAVKQYNFSVTKWTIATFLGWFVGIFFLIGLSGFLDSIGIEKFQFYIGVGLGAGVGFFQWWVIRKGSGIGLEWIWSSILGMGIPFLVCDFVSHFITPLDAYYLPCSVILGAIFIGLLQFFILKKHSSKAKLWLAGSFVGWVLAAATVLSIDYIKLIIHHNWTLFTINLMMILGGGIVLGLITGKVLATILKQ